MRHSRPLLIGTLFNLGILLFRLKMVPFLFTPHFLNGTISLAGELFLAFFLVPKKGFKMLIKFIEDDEFFVDGLKLATKSATAANAFRIAARDFRSNQLLIEDQRSTIESLRLTIERYESIIDNARSAAALLLERVSQADLFDD